jgi:predicted RNase H-like HicB family nuclease
MVGRQTTRTLHYVRKTLSPSLRIPLRVVFYKEGGDWVAHCLEFDVIGDGPTKSKALNALTKAIRIQVAYSFEHQNIDNLFSPAEGKYFRMFAAGKKVPSKNIAIGALKIPLVVDRTEAREYVEEESKDAADALVPA